MEAFGNGDSDAIMAFFTELWIYHSLPMAPAQGTAAIRAAIDGFVNPAEKIDWETINISQADSTVLTERIDRFVIGGKAVALPVMGAFDIVDGKIAAWRDYFDPATWTKQMG